MTEMMESSQQLQDQVLTARARGRTLNTVGQEYRSFDSARDSKEVSYD
ncbi:MAG: hypothetical protein ACJAWL_003162 [Motiliproteus sp.]|jgi:hypothetical protein